MNKITVLIITTLMLVVSGCGERSESSRKMDEAWRLMESAPDSSLVILESMDSIILKKDKDRARYALLKSMALDKNVIDTTTFDVLQPAIDYYPKHGSPDEKLRTYYYQGRIYQNAGRNDEAMRAFVNGLECSDFVNDSLSLARLLVAQSHILNSTYDFKGDLKNNLKAAALYSGVGYYSHCGDCLYMALNSSILDYEVWQTKESMSRVDSIMGLCEAAYEKGWLSEDDYNSSRLTYLEEKDSLRELKTLIHYMVDKKDVSPECMLTLGRVYNFIGHPDSTLQLLKSFTELNQEEYNAKKYHVIMANANKELGHYKDAVSNYENLINLQSDEFEIILKQSLQGSDQRYKLELDKQKEAKDKELFRLFNVILIIVLAAVCSICILIIYLNRTRRKLAEERIKLSNLEIEKLNAENALLAQDKEKIALEVENLKLKVEILEKEKEELNRLLKTNDYSPQIKEAIKIRVEKLNALIAGTITSNEKYYNSYNDWVEELIADTQTFMDTTRLAFKASHPEFIRYFEEKGLTIDEINYVCLYAIGMNGKEVGIYMNRPSHINMSSAIRKKLSMDIHETNLGIYVRRLLKNFGK